MRARHYEQVVALLMRDPILVEMAREVPLLAVEKSGFIERAWHEYRRRGGTIKGHLGGPGEAICRLKGVR